jgi:hypothetical protein
VNPYTATSIPKSVNLGHIVLPVYFKDRGEGSSEEGADFIGSFHSTSGGSWIALRTDETRVAWQTLLHELMHAWSEFAGAELTESQVRALEIGFTTMCRLNPRMVQNMIEVLSGKSPEGT